MRLQEIKKTRIVIASLLKPVDDTRMFEKLGQTLAEEAEVFIIGYPSQASLNYPTITFLSLLPFSRLSFQRAIAPLKIFQMVSKIRPNTFIITTHELLWIGVLSRILFSCHLIYDVQENYSRNIFYTNAFPKLIRPFIAVYVRLKEWLTSPFVNHFLLAERGYEKELRFPGSKKTIIENKTKKQAIIVEKKKTEDIHLIFTGTLSETTGVFTAIELAHQLHSVDPSIRLSLIGYCLHPPTLAKIRNAIINKDFIELIGGDRLIPHLEIIQYIQSAHFGIISYEVNPSIINSIPTKLYEYLGYQLPILMIDHQPWIELAKPYQAAISFSLSSARPETLLSQMKNQTFYTSDPQNVFWESEAAKLKKVVLMT